MMNLKPEYGCSLELHNAILGGKWKLRILWHIYHGDTRFSQLKRTIPEISEKILAVQLRELEEHHLIKRTVISMKPLHTIYELSPEYPELGALVDSLCDFAHIYAKVNGIVVP